MACDAVSPSDCRCRFAQPQSTRKWSPVPPRRSDFPYSTKPNCQTYVDYVLRSSNLMQTHCKHTLLISLVYQSFWPLAVDSCRRQTKPLVLLTICAPAETFSPTRLLFPLIRSMVYFTHVGKYLGTASSHHLKTRRTHPKRTLLILSATLKLQTQLLQNRVGELPLNDIQTRPMTLFSVLLNTLNHKSPYKLRQTHVDERLKPKSSSKHMQTRLD